MSLTLRSILQCPHCGFKAVEGLPAGRGPQTHACLACHKTVLPKPGECCVFCSHGSVPCQWAQEKHPS